MGLGYGHVRMGGIVLIHAGLEDTGYSTGFNLRYDTHGGERAGRGDEFYPVIDTHPEIVCQILADNNVGDTAAGRIIQEIID